MLSEVLLYFPYAIAVFCAIAILIIMWALIFRPNFREAILTGEGQATLGSLITVKGAVLMGLLAFFFFGIFYPVNETKKQCADWTSANRTPSAAIRIIDTYIREELDPKLRPHVIGVIEHLKEDFKHIESGTVTIVQEYAGSKPAIQQLSEMAEGDVIRAVHLANQQGLEDIYAWKNTPLLAYWDSNLDAMKRGAIINRIFVVRKEQLVDPAKNCVKDSGSIEIMENQEKQGVKVYLAWFEDVERQRDLHDLIVFDDEMVQVNLSAWSGKGIDEVELSVNPVTIDMYRERWEHWRMSGFPLAEALEPFRSSEEGGFALCE